MKNRETLIIGTPDSRARSAGADRLTDASKHETVHGWKRNAMYAIVACESGKGTIPSSKGCNGIMSLAPAEG
ncbi:hypothetical protein CGLO_02314 [Colletotrichum gloeosporioides Cg-14]|uniref:Uncharacterized protein n=1 Tax=Colletotrichum gloeosporioides (strain Cg-14) TaxID=1237896 RepID=T0M983_COLGC|nr:hypothetical protein CGLO_02314 [Colletotrichum gloeosporioides Cg-14]